MALFGQERDISLMKHFAKEMMERIVDIQVDVYKLNISETVEEDDIYEESVNSKEYYSPLRVHCIVTRNDQDTENSKGTIDITQSTRFAFLRESLENANLFMQVGDIINWNGKFWEVNTVVENQLIGGKDPDYAKQAPNQDYLNAFGDNWSIVVDTHWTQLSKLNIVNIRNGNND